MFTFYSRFRAESGPRPEWGFVIGAAAGIVILVINYFV